MLATPSAGDHAPARADSSPPTLEVDASKRYSVEGMHAAGGLGRVMRAHDRRLNRTVAVKELLQRSPAAEARFLREALITAGLEHPGIVPVHDVARLPGGEPFYSMKLVAGRTLRELIKDCAGLDERLALLPNLLAVAEAIAYAHSRKVIHRDLKPANIIVGDFGETLVVDWGLAKDLSGAMACPEPVDPTGVTLDTAPSGPDATAIGNVMGTPSYMSPEQARGGEVDPRADVYALGAILYEVLVGEPPYGGATTEEILARAVLGEWVPPRERQPGTPPDLAAIIDKAMAREPAARYPSAIEMAEDLRRFQTGQLVTARRYSTGNLIGRWIARHRAVVAVVAVAGLALAATGVIAFRRVVAQRNVAESERAVAQAATRIAEQRSHELVFRQAQGLLGRDPTAAIATLKAYPPDGPRADELEPLLDEAAAAGVARHVLAHRDPIAALAMAPDGSLVTVEEDREGRGAIRRWDLTSGRGQVIGHLDKLSLARLSPDARLIAYGDDDGMLFVQHLDSGDRVGVGHRAVKVAGLAFSADGGRLLWVAEDFILHVTDTTNGRDLIILNGVSAATLSADGRTLVAASVSGEIAEVAVEGGARRRLARLGGKAHLLVSSPDERFTLVHDHAGTSRLIDRRRGSVRELGQRDLESGHGSATFSPSGDRLAIGSHDGNISVFETATGQLIASQHAHDDTVIEMEFLSDERVLVSVSDDTTARIWNLDSGEHRSLRGHRDDIWRLAISPDGRTLVTGSMDRTVRVWPLAEESVRSLDAGVRHATDMIFSADGRILMAGSKTGKAGRIDLERRVTSIIAGPPGQSLNQQPTVGTELLIGGTSDGALFRLDLRTGVRAPFRSPHRSKVTALALRPDDKVLVSADADGAVLRTDLDTGESRELYRGRVVTVVRFLPSGDAFFAGGVGFLELRDGESGIIRDQADPSKVTNDLVSRIATSADGSTVLCKVGRGLVTWNHRTGRVDTYARGLESTSVSPDGAYLAIASNREVLLRDLTTGINRVLGRHHDFVHAVAFSPDGSTVASASYDRTVRIWHLPTGRVRVLRGHTTAVTTVAFSPDGATLASLSETGALRLWSLAHLASTASTATLTSATLDRAGHPLTP